MLPSERKLEDNYPVYPAYLYVVQHVGGREEVIRSPMNGTVKQMKKLLDIEGEIFNCDITGRDLWSAAV